MRAYALVAVVTAAAALAACRPDFPPQSTSDPHYVGPTSDRHYALPAAQDSRYAPSPTAELSAAPPPSAMEANGPPMVIIRPMR